MAFGAIREWEAGIGCEDCIFGQFTNTSDTNLVIARVGSLELYTLYQRNRETTGLRYEASFPIHERIRKLSKLTLRGRLAARAAQKDYVQILVVSFAPGRLSFIVYDEDKKSLRTLALSNFEASASGVGAQMRAFASTQTSVGVSGTGAFIMDPSQKCIAMLLYDDQLVIQPLNASSDTVTEFEIGDDDQDDEEERFDESGVVGPDDTPKGGSDKLADTSAHHVSSKLSVHNKADLRFVTDFTSRLCRSPLIVELSKMSTTSLAAETRDIAFIEGYIDPTIGLLQQIKPTNASRLTFERHTCKFTALSVDLTTGRYPVVWSIDNLPHDSFELIPAPASTGGVLILSTNAILYANQHQTIALAVNGYASSTVCETRDMKLSPPTEGICFIVERPRWSWLSSSQLLLTVGEGEMYVLTLQQAHGASLVTGIDLVHAGSALAQIQCMATTHGRWMFCGSRTGDSSLVSVLPAHFADCASMLRKWLNTRATDWMNYLDSVTPDLLLQDSLDAQERLKSSEMSDDNAKRRRLDSEKVNEDGVADTVINIMTDKLAKALQSTPLNATAPSERNRESLAQDLSKRLVDVLREEARRNSSLLLETSISTVHHRGVQSSNLFELQQPTGMNNADFDDDEAIYAAAGKGPESTASLLAKLPTENTIDSEAAKLASRLVFCVHDVLPSTGACAAITHAVASLNQAEDSIMPAAPKRNELIAISGTGRSTSIQTYSRGIRAHVSHRLSMPCSLATWTLPLAAPSNDYYDTVLRWTTLSASKGAIYCGEAGLTGTGADAYDPLGLPSITAANTAASDPQVAAWTHQLILVTEQNRTRAIVLEEGTTQEQDLPDGMAPVSVGQSGSRSRGIMREIKRAETDIMLDVPTIAAGPLLGGRRFVQVYPEGIKLFEGMKCIQDIGFYWPADVGGLELHRDNNSMKPSDAVRRAHICDPYVVAELSSGSAHMWRIDTTDWELFQCGCFSSIIGDKTDEIVAVNLFRDNGDLKNIILLNDAINSAAEPIKSVTGLNFEPDSIRLSFELLATAYQTLQNATEDTSGTTITGRGMFGGRSKDTEFLDIAVSSSTGLVDSSNAQDSLNRSVAGVHDTELYPVSSTVTAKNDAKISKNPQQSQAIGTSMEPLMDDDDAALYGGGSTASTSINHEVETSTSLIQLKDDSFNTEDNIDAALYGASSGFAANETKNVSEQNVDQMLYGSSGPKADAKRGKNVVLQYEDYVSKISTSLREKLHSMSAPDASSLRMWVEAHSALASGESVKNQQKPLSSDSFDRAITNYACVARSSGMIQIIDLRTQEVLCTFSSLLNAPHELELCGQDMGTSEIPTEVHIDRYIIEICLVSMPQVVLVARLSDGTTLVYEILRPRRTHARENLKPQSEIDGFDMYKNDMTTMYDEADADVAFHTLYASEQELKERKRQHQLRFIRAAQHSLRADDISVNITNMAQHEPHINFYGFSSLLPRLHPFNNLCGWRGVAVLGRTPIWIVLQRGALRVVPMDVPSIGPSSIHRRQLAAIASAHGQRVNPIEVTPVQLRNEMLRAADQPAGSQAHQLYAIASFALLRNHFVTDSDEQHCLMLLSNQASLIVAHLPAPHSISVHANMIVRNTRTMCRMHQIAYLADGSRVPGTRTSMIRFPSMHEWHKQRALAASGGEAASRRIRTAWADSAQFRAEDHAAAPGISVMAYVREENSRRRLESSAALSRRLGVGGDLAHSPVFAAISSFKLRVDPAEEALYEKKRLLSLGSEYVQVDYGEHREFTEASEKYGGPPARYEDVYEVVLMKRQRDLLIGEDPVPVPGTDGIRYWAPYAHYDDIVTDERALTHGTSQEQRIARKRELADQLKQTNFSTDDVDLSIKGMPSVADWIVEQALASYIDELSTATDPLSVSPPSPTQKALLALYSETGYDASRLQRVLALRAEQERRRMQQLSEQQWRGDAESFPEDLVMPMSDDDMLVVDRFPLLRYERGLCIREVVFADAPGARRESYILVGTGVVSPRGEEEEATGRLIVFRVAYVNAEQQTQGRRSQQQNTRAMLIPKLKYQLDYQFEASVTAINVIKMDNMDYIFIGIGKTVEIHKWQYGRLTKVGFYDGTTYPTSMTVSKNLLVCGDFMRSVRLYIWRPHLYDMTLLAQDSMPLHTISTSIISEGNKLSICAADAEGNMVLFGYDPQGNKKVLANRADVNILSPVTDMLPIRLLDKRTTQSGPPMSNSPFTMRYGTIGCNVDGGFCAVVPLDERTCKRLIMLQKLMVYAVPHVCGVNPKFARSCKLDDLPGYIPNRNFADGSVLWRYFDLDWQLQSDLAAAIGSSRERIIADLSDIDQASLVV